MTDTLYRWHWRKRLPERHGQVFRVLCRGALNSCLIQFESDGWKCVTSRNALIPRMKDLPTESEWDHYGNLGDKIARQAISDATIQLLSSGAHPSAILAVGFGALKAVGQYLQKVSNPDGAAVLEQNAIAYLRGALRDADGPIMDNGKPFTVAIDA